MTESIAGALCLGAASIRERFPLAPDDWDGARAARDAHPAPPWSEDEWEELSQFNLAAGAPSAALESLRALRDPRAYAVVTGQQAGLALGPLYTLYKAIGAIRRARRLEQRWGVPVVPCFWIASEDHDFEEARSVCWLGQSGQRQTFRYEPAQDTADRPVGEIGVESSLYDLIERLEQTTAPTEFRPQVFEWLRQALAGSPNLEMLFAQLLMGLLGKHGLVCLAPRLLRFRRRALGIFRREIERPGELTRLLLEAGAALRRNGFEVLLHRREGDLNFFWMEDGRRLKLEWRQGKIAIGHGDGSPRLAEPGELLAAAQDDPRRLSGNVVTRPICQDLSLPTVAYIAGPGELAYFAQLREAYEACEAMMPIISRRPSAALLDAPASRLLAKTQIDARDLMEAGAADLARRLSVRPQDRQALQTLEDARNNAKRMLESLQGSLAGISPAIEKSVARLAETQEKGFATVAQRLERELAQRNEARMAAFERARQWLAPDGKPQERIFSALAPLLTNYGFEAIDRLVKGLDIDSDSTQIVDLAKGAANEP